MKISKSKHTETKSQVTDNDYICDHCEEEFNNEKLHREHTHSCLICKVTFNKYSYSLKDHITYNHEELYCENCGNFFTTQTKIVKHNKQCIRCNKFHQYFKTISELRKHNKKCVPSTDESESYESSN